MPHPHDHDPAHCRELFEKMSEYIDGELDPAAAADIRRHLADCPHCAVCRDTLQRTVDLCRNLPDRPVPPDFSAKLALLVAERFAPGPAAPGNGRP
jgi:anti-sigma factor RsiW